MNAPSHVGPAGRPRARGLGLPFTESCGVNNAITDVGGIEVGYTTLISGNGPLQVGQGPVRTGVTVIHPRGKERTFEPVWAGFSSFNGNGEMTGTHFIQEAGHFCGPVAITNTHSVGLAHHGLIRWMTSRNDFNPAKRSFLLPVAAETCDSHLNDINGLHLTEAHVIDAANNATGGPIEEGNVGGGTGMIAYEFKGGTGTASRIATIADGRSFTVGALVQANFGRRPDLTVCGVPIGQELTENPAFGTGRGSIIVIVATDAPLMPTALNRLARRAGLGMGRTGAYGSDGSGDIFLAFSTGNSVSDCGNDADLKADYLPQQEMDPLFKATVGAVEEAIINAMLAAETMVGRDDNTVVAMDHGALLDVMKRYNRVA